MASRIPAFEREPYRRELDVKVLESAPAAGDDPAWAILDDTIIYPEGGGQPSDRGRLGEARVVATERRDGRIRHLLDRAVPTGPDRLVLDWERRHDHMQQHTAQHLLTAVALARFGWATTAFHLGDEVSSIDLDTAPPGTEELDALERAALEEVHADRRVTTRRVDGAELERLLADGEVRSRRLPAGHHGDVRLVEIEGLDVNTCGGTHVASLAEIATLKLLAVETAHGGCRLGWVAGDRVRRRLASNERTIHKLRRLFETSAGELPAVAGLKLDQLRQAERRLRGLEERYAASVAERLAACGPASTHFDDADGSFLQRVARAYTAAGGDGVVLLTASGERGDFFALAAGEQSAIDLPRLGRTVAELLDGRGGGSGRLFQGKASRLAKRTEAVAAVEAVAGLTIADTNGEPAAPSD